MENKKQTVAEGDLKASLKASDEQLARQVAQGDAAALESLYERYSRPAINLAYRIVGNLELAEEVAQEAFLRFWERPDLYRAEQGRFVSWLLSVVHHRAINERRRSAFRLNVSADATLVAAGSGAGAGGEDKAEVTILHRLDDGKPGPEEMVWLAEQRSLVRQALRQLSEPQRQVIELAYFHGLNQSEIARRLDQPLGTVKTRTRLALQKLRGLLSAEEMGLVGAEV